MSFNLNNLSAKHGEGWITISFGANEWPSTAVSQGSAQIM